MQAGLVEVNRITEGASGQKEIDWSKALLSGSVQGGIMGAVSVPFMALFKYGREIVSNAMQKLGELVGLNAGKAKFVAGNVPDAKIGMKLDVMPSLPSSGRRVDLDVASVAAVADDVIISVAGKDLFQVPKAMTRDLASAATWYREQMGRISQMVDRNAPFSEQLKQAQKLQELIMQAATHSLADELLAGWFREAFNRLGIEQLATKFGGPGGLSGQNLKDKIFAELMSPIDTLRRWFEPGVCFAAGTLVHTKDGLKPIEQIKVGDWVLSKPENGGEQAYKRVLTTFAHPPARVIKVKYYIPAHKPNKYGGNIGQITSTLNHPFWIKELGWTAASELENYGRKQVHFEDVDGLDIDFSTLTNIYISDRPNVGWTSNQWPEDVRLGGTLWDYVAQRVVAADVLPIKDVFNKEHPSPYLELPVYNLEVEDFHTYYVGQHGIWVHNRNCGGLNFEIRNTANPLKSVNKATAFFTGTEMINTLAARRIKEGVFLLQAHINSQYQKLGLR